MPYAANPPPSPLERSCIVAIPRMITSPAIMRPSLEMSAAIAQPAGILTDPSRSISNNPF
ncbi:hypothetical protein [Selenomonas flueggei]|uniref:hypothetical protein n=1 Tax=Selenomonas flueggei TaxID=135080 RepID=UPI001FDF0853